MSLIDTWSFKNSQQIDSYVKALIEAPQVFLAHFRNLTIQAGISQ